MSKGGFSVFLALLSGFLVALLLMTFARYVAEWWFPNENLETPDFTWEIFVQLIGLRDTGDNANLATKLVGVVTIFVGLVLFSSLVAFITQEFEAKLQSLRKGKSLVVEQNHTLILGFNDRIVDIIKELVLANESEQEAVLVILSERDKEEMDDFLRSKIGALKTTKLVTRSGSITNINNLNLVAIKAAKSVIVLNDAKSADDEKLKYLSDARVVKAVLAVVAANGEINLPPIIVEIHSDQYRRLAESIVPGFVTTLNEADILARILVQTSRSVGLAAVYLNLVGFEGNEFYFYRPAGGWLNLTFAQLPFHFSNGMPIGLRHPDGTLILKPSNDYLLADSDKVVIIAEDDSKIQFFEEPIVRVKDSEDLKFRQTAERQTEKYLVMGWNSKTPIALREYAKYLIEGSQVNLAVQELTREIQTEFDRISKENPHIMMDALEINLDSVEDLKTLKPYDFSSISILAGSGENAEEIDARTLTILLELRKIFKDYLAETGNTVTTELIAEIIDSEDTDLVIQAGVKDFLLTNQFVSKIVAQVSQEPNVMAIYRNLFSVDGSELYIKPVSLYFPPERIVNKRINKLTFADCVVAAQQRNEVCIGIRIHAQAQDKDSNFGIILVPNLDKRFILTVEDSLITLAEDQS